MLVLAHVKIADASVTQSFTADGGGGNLGLPGDGLHEFL